MLHCYGVIAHYPLRGKVDLAATDAEVMRVARQAVPRIPRFVDSGAGPFCVRKPCRAKPVRSLEIDTISLKRGLTRAEKGRLTAAFRRAGISFYVKRDACYVSRG